MTFPFLQLPAELRCRIYLYAFIPPSVRFSIRDDRISMYAFSNSKADYIQDIPELSNAFTPDDGCSTVPVSLWNFVINAQLWYEISDMFYTHTTWTFPSVEIAKKCLLEMSPGSRDKICKIFFTLAHRKLGEMNIRPGKDLRKILEKLPRLRILTVQVRLEAFHTQKSSWEMAVTQRPPGETDEVAAKWVAQFIRQGLETRLPFQERALSRYFLEGLKKLCGEKNMRIEVVGHDRYAGKLVDVVIGSAQSARRRINPSRQASFERFRDSLGIDAV